MDILNILLEISIYSAVIYLAIMLLKKVFHNKLSPVLHYAVWMLLIIRLMIPFTIDSNIKLFVIPQAQEQQETAADAESAAKSVLQQSITDSPSYSEDYLPEYEANLAAPPVSDITASATSATALSWSIEDILLAVWIAGAGISLLYIAFSYFMFRRRLKRDAAPVTKRVQVILEQCKREMHIDSKIKVIGIYNLGSPALFISSTILMPMELLVSMSDKQIKYALGHELTRYRRKDHIVCMLLLLMQSAYWFNPFVWLAFRQIRTDVEIACDSAAVKCLDISEKRSYANMIVSMFAQRRNKQLVLGMAQGDTKKAAEQRVRGIFMNSRSKKSGKLVAMLLAAVLLVTCFTTACQPTPEKPVVINKAEGQLEEKISQTELPEEKYEAPEKWQQDYEVYDGKLKIEIDADISMPNVTAYPVLEVIPEMVSQEMADKIIDSLFGDTPVYEIKTQRTKAELQDWLIELKAEYRKMGKDSDTHVVHTDEGESMSELDRMAKAIKEIEAQIETAPETVERQLLDTTFKVDERGTEYIAGQADMGYSIPAYVRIENGGSDYPYASVSYYNDVENLAYYTGESDNPTGLSFTKEQAVEQAQDFLDNIGVKDMYAAHIEMLSEWENDNPVSEELSGYRIHFERIVSGIQVPFRIWLGTISPEDAPDFSAAESMEAASRNSYRQPIPAEELSITICEDGIREVRWQGLIQVTQEINANAALMPFDDIKDRFAQMISVKNAYYEEVEAQGKELYQVLYVDRIEFGYARVPIKDEFDTFMFVPSWAFYGGTKSAEYTDEDGNLQKSEPFSPGAARRNVECLLAVNAIDGSIIERY